MDGRGSSSNKSSGIIKNTSDNYGKPGTYEVFRTGNLSAPN